MRQAIIKLRHPVVSVRRDAVAALRRHHDGPALEAPESSANTADARAVEQLTRALERAVAQCQEWRRSLESQLHELRNLAVEVGVAVAEKLLHQEIRQGRHDVERLVASALVAGGSRTPAVIKLSQADTRRLQESGVTLADGDEAVRIVADPHLTDGNVELDLPGFSLVFDWRHELETIKRNILNDLNHAES